VAVQGKLRVVVVDDSEVVRMKLRGLLEEGSFDLVGEADSGKSGLEVVKKTQPDVVVMDLRMPGMSGIEATWRLGSVSPSSRVLVLTVSEEEDDVADAIMAGARGYVIKGAGDEEIRAALHGVAAGERVISPQVADKLAERLREDRPAGRFTTPSPAAPSAPRMRTPEREAREAEDGDGRVGTRASVERVSGESAPWPWFWTFAIAVVSGALLTVIAGGDHQELKFVLDSLVAFAAVNLALLAARGL
jgi:DNA-binding NarL/FixJ family response regulator